MVPQNFNDLNNRDSRIDMGKISRPNTTLMQIKEIESKNIVLAVRLYTAAAKSYFEAAKNVDDDRLVDALLYYSLNAAKKAEMATFAVRNKCRQSKHSITTDKDVELPSRLTKKFGVCTSQIVAKENIKEESASDPVLEILSLEATLDQLGPPEFHTKSKYEESSEDAGEGVERVAMDESFLVLSPYVGIHLIQTNDNSNGTNSNTNFGKQPPSLSILDGFSSSLTAARSPYGGQGSVGGADSGGEGQRRGAGTGWTSWWWYPKKDQNISPAPTSSPNRAGQDSAQEAGVDTLPWEGRGGDGALLDGCEDSAPPGRKGSGAGSGEASVVAGLLAQVERLSRREAELIGALRAMSEENERISDKLKAVADARDIEERVRGQMEKFKTEYMIRFDKIRKLLPSEEQRMKLKRISWTSPLEPSRDRSDSGAAASSDEDAYRSDRGSTGTLVEPAGGGASLEERNEQLERIVRRLLSKLESSKGKMRAKIQAKDDEILSLKAMLGQQNVPNVQTLQMPPAKPQTTLIASPSVAVSTAAAGGNGMPGIPSKSSSKPVSSHKHPSTATLETSLQRPLYLKKL